MHNSQIDTPGGEAGGMTRARLIKLLTSLEADLRAFRDFCDPHPLGPNVSECILESLDPTIGKLVEARQLFGCRPAEPNEAIAFYCRDFQFLDEVGERAAAIEREDLAMANEEISDAMDAIDELRSTFHYAYKYAEEIEDEYEDDEDEDEDERDRGGLTGKSVHR